MLEYHPLLGDSALDLATMAALLGEGHERPNLLDAAPSRTAAARAPWYGMGRRPADRSAVPPAAERR